MGSVVSKFEQEAPWGNDLVAAHRRWQKLLDAVNSQLKTGKPVILNLSEIDTHVTFIRNLVESMGGSIVFSPPTNTGKCGVTAWFNIDGEGLDLLPFVEDNPHLVKAVSDMALRCVVVDGVAHVGLHYPATAVPAKAENAQKLTSRFVEILVVVKDCLTKKGYKPVFSGDHNGMGAWLAENIGLNYTSAGVPTGFGATAYALKHLGGNFEIDGVMTSLDTNLEGFLTPEDAVLSKKIADLHRETKENLDVPRPVYLKDFLGGHPSDHAAVVYQVENHIVIVASTLGPDRYQSTSTHWKQPRWDHITDYAVLKWLEKHRLGEQEQWLLKHLLTFMPLPESLNVMVPEKTLKAVLEITKTFPGIPPLKMVGGGPFSLLVAQTALQQGIELGTILSFLRKINDVDVKILVNSVLEETLRSLFNFDKLFAKKFKRHIIPFFEGWFLRTINGHLFLHWKGGSDDFEGLDVVFTQQGMFPMKTEALYSSMWMLIDNEKVIDFLLLLENVKNNELLGDQEHQFLDMLRACTIGIPENRNGYITYPRPMMEDKLREMFGFLYPTWAIWFATLSDGELSLICAMLGDASRVYRYDKMVKKLKMMNALLGEKNALSFLFPDMDRVLQLLKELITKLITSYNENSPYEYLRKGPGSTLEALSANLLNNAWFQLEKLKSIAKLATNDCSCTKECVRNKFLDRRTSCDCKVKGCVRCHRYPLQLYRTVDEVSKLLQQEQSGNCTLCALPAKGNWKKREKESVEAKVLEKFIHRIVAGLNKSNGCKDYVVTEQEDCWLRKSIGDTLTQTDSWIRACNNKDVLHTLVTTCYTGSIIFRGKSPVLKEDIVRFKAVAELLRDVGLSDKADDILLLI